MPRVQGPRECGWASSSSHWAGSLRTESAESQYQMSYSLNSLKGGYIGSRVQGLNSFNGVLLGIIWGSIRGTRGIYTKAQVKETNDLLVLKREWGSEHRYYHTSMYGDHLGTIRGLLSPTLPYHSVLCIPNCMY